MKITINFQNYNACYVEESTVDYLFLAEALQLDKLVVITSPFQ